MRRERQGGDNLFGGQEPLSPNWREEQQAEVSAIVARVKRREAAKDDRPDSPSEEFKSSRELHHTIKAIFKAEKFLGHQVDPNDEDDLGILERALGQSEANFNEEMKSYRFRNLLETQTAGLPRKALSGETSDKEFFVNDETIEKSLWLLGRISRDE